MREIKFRAWDKRGKRMVWGNCGLFMFVGTGTLGWQFADTWDFPVDEQFELMQYTGLKDKNGKEIYEGDIVAFRDRKGELRKGFEVKWGAIMGEQGVYGFGFDIANTEKVEIIGNLYENKELLK